VGGRLGPHGLRRRQPDRGAHRAQTPRIAASALTKAAAASACCARMNSSAGKRKNRWYIPTSRCPSHTPAERAEQRARDDDAQRELEVVPADLAIAETEGLEDRDLLALQRDQTAHHRVGHERGHAQEHQGKPIESACSSRISSVTRVSDWWSRRA